MTTPTPEPMKAEKPWYASRTMWGVFLGLGSTLDAVYGVSGTDPKTHALAAAVAALLTTYGRVKASTALTAIAVFACVVLTGCQGLSQALGVQPRADAPSYTVVGVYARDSATAGDVAKSMRTDQSGAVGATGSADATASQTLEIPQEVMDKLIESAQALIAAGNPVAASGILDAVKSTSPKKKAAPPAPVPAAPSPAPVIPVPLATGGGGTSQ